MRYSEPNWEPSERRMLGMRDTKPLPHPGNLRDVVSLAKTPKSFFWVADGHTAGPVEVKICGYWKRFPNSTQPGTRKGPNKIYFSMKRFNEFQRIVFVSVSN